MRETQVKVIVERENFVYTSIVKLTEMEITMEDYNIVYEGGVGELVEKKSRFIATVAPVATEEEALSFIEAQKKKYWDARHNCHAYIVGGFEAKTGYEDTPSPSNEILRFSDDGEPQGTAGKPILEVLQGAKVHNAVVVVTRYFGGTLLGTGGLVRAYSTATQLGLENSKLVLRQEGLEYEVATDYNGIGKLQYLAGQMGLRIGDCEYTEAVKMKILVPEDKCAAFVKKVTEATNGKAFVKEAAFVYFGELDGESLLFERIEKEKD
jgi:uncharacterized YigZ family protein